MGPFTRKYMALGLIIFLIGLPGSTLAETLAIGSISSNPAKEIKRFKPLIEYLKNELVSSGIDKIEMRIANSISEMISLMKAGKVDVYLDSPFPSLTVAESGAGDIVLRRWKKGVEEYHSVIFVKKDSDIERPEDLQGKIIAFEEPFSTSSFYIPKSSLQQQGLTLSEKKNRHDTVEDNEIGYIFSDDDSNTVTWVRKNRVAAGAVNNIKFDSLKARFKDQLRIIFRSVNVPRQVVTYSKLIPASTAENLTRALVNMDKTEYGRTQLKAFEKTRKFDHFPESIDLAMAPIRKLAKAFH